VAEAPHRTFLPFFSPYSVVFLKIQRLCTSSACLCGRFFAARRVPFCRFSRDPVKYFSLPLGHFRTLLGTSRWCFCFDHSFLTFEPAPTLPCNLFFYGHSPLRYLLPPPSDKHDEHLFVQDRLHFPTRERFLVSPAIPPAWLSFFFFVKTRKCFSVRPGSDGPQSFLFLPRWVPGCNIPVLLYKPWDVHHRGV